MVNIFTNCNFDIMSRCLRGCDDDRNTFTFSKRLATFHEAKNYCKLSRGTLVQKLSKSSYAALLQCCPGHREYWIGLQNVGASKCSKKKGFQWIGSKTCTDGSPFKLNLQPVNNNECKAVVIIGSHSANNNQNLPRTRVQNCNSTYIYYICQTAKQNRNPSTITTTKLTTRILTREIKTSSQINGALTSTTKLNLKSFNNFFTKNCQVQTDSSWLRVRGFIGGAVGFNVLIFLLLIILFCFKKRIYEKKQEISRSNNFRGFSRDQTPSTTYWWLVVYSNRITNIRIKRLKFFSYNFDVLEFSPSKQIEPLSTNFEN